MEEKNSYTAPRTGSSMIKAPAGSNGGSGDKIIRGNDLRVGK